LLPKQAEDYSPFIPELDRAKIVAEVPKFELEGKGKDSILFRKVKEGLKAPYIEFPFHGDLMQEVHD
jgi:hypothetical protein